MVVRRSRFFEAVAQDAGEAFNEDVARHFGLTKAAIHKDDWRLNDSVPLLENAVSHLYLECVALGLNGIQIKVFQNFTSIATEASGTIVDGDPQHEACIDIAPATDDAA